jgi:hypothetical protein
MEPGEALSIAAQIAVTLAGFAGVVVAFRSSSLHEWAPVDKYRLWLLLGSALVPLFACLFGMLLLTILLIFPFGFLSRRHQSELGPTEIKDMGASRYFLYVFAILGTAVGLLQAYNALIPGIFWFFYIAIIFQLAVGTLQFARMILLPPHTSKT